MLYTIINITMYNFKKNGRYRLKIHLSTVTRALCYILEHSCNELCIQAILILISMLNIYFVFEISWNRNKIYLRGSIVFCEKWELGLYCFRKNMEWKIYIFYRKQDRKCQLKVPLPLVTKFLLFLLKHRKWWLPYLKEFIDSIIDSQ